MFHTLLRIDKERIDASLCNLPISLRTDMMYTIVMVICCLSGTQISRAAVINVPADQPTIQAAITAALPGDTIILDNTFSPFAEGLITIPVAKNNLTIDGQSSVILSSSGSWGLSIEADDVIIKDLTMNGAGTFGFITGDPANGGNGLTLENVSAISNGGTGFAITGVNNITLTDLTATNNGGNGMSITSVQNLTLTDYTSSGNMFGGGFGAGIGIFSCDSYTPCGTDNVTVTGVIDISENPPIYSQENVCGMTCGLGMITNINLNPSNISFEYFLGIADTDKYYYTNLTAALEASDLTLQANPAARPVLFVEEIASGDKYIAPANLAADNLSIQAAINYAVAGSDINFLAGIMSEGAQIVVDRNINLVGAGKLVSELRPGFNTGSSGDSRGWFLVNAGVEINVTDLSFNGSGNLVYQAFRHRGSGTFDNVNFTEIKYNESGPTYSGVAIAAFGDDNVDVVNSMFSEIGRIGVLYFGTGITNSLFKGNMYTGKGVGDWLDYALDISAGAVVSVDSNTISDNRGVASSDGSTSAGILVSTFFGPGTEADITRNTVSNNSTGIFVGFNASDASTVTANNNDIVGNSFGVNSTNPVVDATLNWWGDVSGPGPVGPGVGDPISANVTFCPWLDAPMTGQPVVIEPVIITCPPDLAQTCEEDQDPMNTGEATATGQLIVSIVYSDSTEATGIAPVLYTIYRTWIATNACGTADTCTQVIEIIDTTPPMISGCPGDISYVIPQDGDCDTTLYWPQPTATDDCDLLGFRNLMDTSNWEVRYTGPGMGNNGTVDETGAPNEITLVGSSNGIADMNSNVDYCMSFPARGTVSFDFSAEATGGQLNNDEAAFVMDGVEYIIASGSGCCLPMAFAEIELQGPTEICLRVKSNGKGAITTFNVYNIAYNQTTITQISGPESDSSPGAGDGDVILPGTYEVVYEAEDGLGNLSYCRFDIHVAASRELLCKDINVSIDANCGVKVIPEMLLAGIYPCYDIFEVEITAHGTVIGDSIGIEYLGETLTAKVTDPSTGNSCWSEILVEDKQPPTIDECRDVTVNCIDFAFNRIPVPTATDLCQNDTVMLIDQLITKTPCDPANVMTVIRKYVAIDQSGNVSLDTCMQEITVERFPIGSATLVGQNMNTDVSCSSGFEVDANGYIKPEYVSVPMLGPLELYPYNDEYCDVYINYSDVLIYEIGCELQILRTWIIREWHCNIQREQRLQQYITIIDDNGPSISGLPDSLYAKAGQRSCDADVDMPRAIVTDACHDGDRIDMIYPGGSKQYQNGGLINLPIGFNPVIYRAYDSCYNVTEDTVIVHVQDKVAPIAICEEFLSITLGSNGTTDIPAVTFDDGSFDECAIERFEVRRMDTTCAPNGDEWGPGVTFCCADIGDTVMVPFRVIDSSGNVGGCMVRVFVRDEQPPRVAFHLPNILVECSFDFDTSNLNVFGKFVTDPALRDSIIKQPEFRLILGPPLDGLVMDNCELTIKEEVDIDSINQCGQGKLFRKFTFSDPYGNDATSVQTIFFEDAVPFNERDIIWPEHLDTFNICDIDSVQPGLLPIEHGFPRFLRNDECSLVGYDFEDDIIDASQGNEACYKVLRYWTVIDWCQSVRGSHATWRDTQVIVVTNTRPPVFDGLCADTVKCFFKNDCDPDTITLIASAMDDCTGANDLFWTFKIDLGNDGSFDTIGRSNDASGVYPLDTHRIKFIVEDLCGNKDSCEYLFELRNCKGPIAYCDDSLAFRLVPYDTTTPPDGILDYKYIDVPARAFYALDSGQVQNCGRPFFISYDSTDIFDTIRRFECDDVGFDSLYVYYIDTFVDIYSSCLVTYEVQDTMLGPPCTSFTGTVSGLMQMSDGRMVENVEVDLTNSGANTIVSARNGYYAFPNMPLGGIYEVVPTKDGDDLNGVSTADLVALQRHLLGKKEITDPYQLIAGDVNNSRSVSAADISELRRLILGVYPAFPDNTSWRFVDAGHTFSDAKNPWQDNWPEKYRIEPFVQDMAIDFYSVKVGDVTGDVQVIGLDDENQTRSAENLQVQDRSFDAGEMISVAFQLPNIEDIQGYQFTLEWNTDYLEYLGLIPNTGLDVDFHNFSEHMVEQGALTTSWHTTSSWFLPKRADRTMFTVEFRANKSGQLSDLIQTSGLVTANEVLYKGSEQVSDMQLLFDNQTASQFFALYQNVPNPWEEMTTIAFHLPETDNVKLTIFDESGRSLAIRNGQFDRGYNEVQIRRDELSSSGVLFYRVETSSHTAMKKMIMMK